MTLYINIKYVREIIYYCFCILSALAFGSFTNVLIYRIPKKLSIVSPGSFCPECNHELSWKEKIPVISYLFLKAKCSGCGATITRQYPVIEIIVMLVALPFIDLVDVVNYFFIITFISISIALGWIDQKYKELPHALTYSGIIIGIIYATAITIPFQTLPQDLTGKLLTTLINLGIVMFSLDAFTHITNLIWFKKEGEKIASSALSLRINFLEKNISWLYFILIATIIFFIRTENIEYLYHLFVILGLSYLVNEILIDHFFSKKPEDEKTVERKKTVLGGGDIAMLGFISVVTGYSDAFIILLMAFYLSFFWVLIKKAIKMIKKCDKPMDKQVPLGLSLAIVFIADMMFKVLYKPF